MGKKGQTWRKEENWVLKIGPDRRGVEVENVLRNCSFYIDSGDQVIKIGSSVERFWRKVGVGS